MMQLAEKCDQYSNVITACEAGEEPPDCYMATCNITASATEKVALVALCRVVRKTEGDSSRKRHGGRQVPWAPNSRGLARS